MHATGDQATGRKWGGASFTFACYNGSDYFLEFKSLNFATGELGKAQVRDLVQVVGIVVPLPHGGHYQGKIRFIEPKGGGVRRPVTGAKMSSTPLESQANSGTGPCGDCIQVLWVPGPRGQYSGKIRFIENPGVQDEGVRRSSDTRVAYPEVKVQVRDLVRIVGIVAPFDQGDRYPGQILFIVPQEICAVCPRQRYATVEPGKVQRRDRMGIVEGSSGYRTRGLLFGENSFC